MNRNQLKYFIAAAESQSFSKAAEQFYISQTAITQQIQTLEAGLECKLFNRNTRPVSLTPAGRAFLTEAKAIVERMERAQERVHEASEGLAGNVRIGYVRGYERSNLSNAMRDFHVHHENILLTYYRDYSDTLAAGLLNDEYDIIFTWDSTNLALEKSIEHIFYERSRLVAVLYASHPFARRESLTRADLKSEDLIIASHSSAQDSYGDAYFMNLYKAAGYRPNIVARVTEIESALMMVATEEGITIMPQFCTAKIANADNLVFVPMEGEHEEEEIIAAWKKDNSNPALRMLLDSLIS